MAYDIKSSCSSWDKLIRKQSKKTKNKPRPEKEIDLSNIPESYMGNEDAWDDLSEKFSESA